MLSSEPEFHNYIMKQPTDYSDETLKPTGCLSNYFIFQAYKYQSRTPRQYFLIFD